MTNRSIKPLETAIACALLLGALHAECVLMPPLESSPHVRVHVSMGGKPLAGAQVIIRHFDDCNCATDILRGNPLDTRAYPVADLRVTDQNGVADLPELAPGDYSVAATLNDVASTAFVGLRVSDKPGVTTIQRDLTGQVQTIEKLPIAHHLQAFRGTISDFAGMAIANARIVVVKRGSQAREVAVRNQSDATGNFSANLANGSYLAIFFSLGYRPAIVPFEITRTGERELAVRMAVGGCP